MNIDKDDLDNVIDSEDPFSKLELDLKEEVNIDIPHF